MLAAQETSYRTRCVLENRSDRGVRQSIQSRIREWLLCPRATYAHDSIALALRQFRFDLIEGTADSVQEIERVNNMAWEFMKVDEMAFADAIRLAAEIVVSCEVSACEAAYEDVQALWRRLSG